MIDQHLCKKLKSVNLELLCRKENDVIERRYNKRLKTKRQWGFALATYPSLAVQSLY